MQIDEIIEIVRNRLSSLCNGRAQSVAVGDLVAVMSLDTQIEETKRTLEQLEAAKQ